MMNDFVLPTNVYLDSNGVPLSSSNKQEWLKARLTGVTATDVNKIISPTLKPSSQSVKLLESKLNISEHVEEPHLNSYMIHGNEREPIIADWAAGNFGMIPNSYLFYGDNVKHLATPDGLGEGFVGEIKTSMKPLKSILNYYMNQIQWQLNVMQVEKCLFIVEQHDNFNPKNIDYMWVERDEKRIKTILTQVDIFIEQLSEKLEQNA